MSDIRIGDMVQTGVYVLGEWRPTYAGRVVRLSDMMTAPRRTLM